MRKFLSVIETEKSWYVRFENMDQRNINRVDVHTRKMPIIQFRISSLLKNAYQTIIIEENYMISIFSIEFFPDKSYLKMVQNSNNKKFWQFFLHESNFGNKLFQ